MTARRVTSPADLRAALLARPIPLVRAFTENLMAYALGRRVEYFDQPTVRRIAAAAAADGYRMSSFVRGVIASDAFPDAGCRKWREGECRPRRTARSQVR